MQKDWFGSTLPGGSPGAKSMRDLRDDKQRIVGSFASFLNRMCCKADGGSLIWPKSPEDTKTEWREMGRYLPSLTKYLKLNRPIQHAAKTTSSFSIWPERPIS